MINNHFTSRFGSSPIFGGPQPFVLVGEDTRESQALVMHELALGILGDDENDDEDANIVILGDLNTFEFTNDLSEILPGTGKKRTLKNLIKKNRDDNKYSFIFEGNSQALDHIFVTKNLFKKARLTLCTSMSIFQGYLPTSPAAIMDRCSRC